MNTATAASRVSKRTARSPCSLIVIRANASTVPTISFTVPTARFTLPILRSAFRNLRLPTQGTAVQRRLLPDQGRVETRQRRSRRPERPGLFSRRKISLRGQLGRKEQSNSALQRSAGWDAHEQTNVFRCHE